MNLNQRFILLPWLSDYSYIWTERAAFIREKFIRTWKQSLSDLIYHFLYLRDTIFKRAETCDMTVQSTFGNVATRVFCQCIQVLITRQIKHEWNRVIKGMQGPSNSFSKLLFWYDLESFIPDEYTCMPIQGAIRES